MHHALGEKCPVIRRPKGAKGRIKTDFMWPAVAFSVIEAADAIDAEFGLYLRLLIYTGIRKSEGLGILSADVQPRERAAWLRDSKNEDPRMLKLREDIVGPLQAHLEANSGERLSASMTAATSNTFCCGPSSTPVACRARCAARPDGSHRSTVSRSLASTPSDTPGRRGCAAMAAPMSRGSTKPATGATQRAPPATLMWSRGTSGIAWTTCPATRGIHGEKQPMSEIR